MSRSLAKNSLFNVAYQVLNVIFPLITASYVARILQPESQGLVATAQNWVQYFAIFAALGIPNYAIREIAKSREDTKSFSIRFSELFNINALSTTISLIAYIIVVLCVPDFRDQLALYAVVGLTIVFNFISIDWVYQGVEQYGYITLRSTIVKCLSLVALFLFVHSRNDYVAYALITVCGTGLNNALNVFHLRSIGVKYHPRSFNFKRHIKPVLLVFSTIISIKVYTLLDVSLLSIMTNSKAVAYYTNSDKIVRLLITVISGIGSVLLPRISLYHSQGKFDECARIVSRVFEILLFLFLPVGIGLILTASQIVLILFGSAYAAAIPTMQIMSLLIFALGFSNLFGTQVLLAFGKEKQLMIATIAGGAVNVVLNLVLIPKFLQNGTAVASVVSEAMVTIITYHLSKKYITYTVRRSAVVKTFIASLLMVPFILLIQHCVPNVFISFVCSVVAGGMVFLISSILMKNPMLDFFKSYAKRLIKR